MEPPELPEFTRKKAILSPLSHHPRQSSIAWTPKGSRARWTAEMDSIAVGGAVVIVVVFASCFNN